MAKEEIKKILENSKKELDLDHDNFVKAIKDDLTSFKKENSGSNLRLLSYHDLNMDIIESDRK